MLGEGIQLPFGDQAWLSMARQQQTTWWSCCLVFSNPWNIFASRDRHPKIETYLKQPTSKTQNTKLVSLVCETFDTTYYKNDWHWNHWTFKLVWTISKTKDYISKHVRSGPPIGCPSWDPAIGQRLWMVKSENSSKSWWLICFEMPQMLHVWNICLHLGHVGGKCR